MTTYLSDHHYGAEEQACETCSMFFGDLEEHERQMGHGDYFDYWTWCDTCSMRFGSDEALRRHEDDQEHGVRECDDCYQEFYSQEALEDHQQDCGHGPFRHECETCNKQFGDANALQQHQDSKGHGEFDEDEDSDYDDVDVDHAHPVPHAGISGMWLPRDEFFGARKSFGRFSCRCGHQWGSAHAFKAFRQGCQRCDREMLPCCMWKNDSTNGRQAVRRPEAGQPHDQELCEACRAGVCIL